MEYASPPFLEPELLEYLIKRLGFTESEFEEIMSIPPKYYYEYKTYKKIFELLRPYFWVMYKFSLVPKSFYLKYACKKGF